MIEPTPAPLGRTVKGGPHEASASPGQSWFRTLAGRRYGWEIALIIVVKLVLLVVLWFAFIMPWPRAATAPAVVVQQLYAPSALAPRRD